MKVSISQKVWRQIRAHAAKSFPNECVGLYIFSKDKDRDVWHVLQPYKCHNVSEEKTLRSEISKRQLRKVARECEKDNKKLRSAKLSIRFCVGQYHSHPTTGNCIQSSTDRAAGMKIKEFRHQLILGVKSKNQGSIRKKFYYHDSKTRKWTEAEIEIDRY